MIRQRRRSKRFLAVTLLIAAAGVAAYFYWFDDGSKHDSSPPNQPSTENESEAETTSFPLVDLQPTIDAWADRQGGQASVVVYDLANKRTVASLNPDNQYFATSIYKLYVAYMGYQKVADGTYGLEDAYLSGYNRGKCLDAMIRDSYSPCGEKMWSELGKDKLTSDLKKYGLANTSMTGLYTSAKDAATILQRLFERRDLSDAHTNAFLDSLKTQDATYRRGLPTGFSEASVYNKVGWNEQVEWHDAAIVTLPSGQSYVVSVMTENVGSAQIAALGQDIESRVTR